MGNKTKVSFYKPQIGDLWFREALLGDPDTMSYNNAWGGTIPFPEEKWRDWYARWVAGDKERRFYRYVRNENGVFVGEVAYHFDDAREEYMANVVIHAKHRGAGFGASALDALCDAARKNGVARLFDDLAADNPALGMFLRRGFTEVRRTEKTILLRKEL